jgi:hypothetical protein
MCARDLSITSAAVIGAVALAACGSSNKPVASNADQGIELAQCMRSHGVPNFPDIPAGGGIDFSPGSGINPRSPAFQAAQQACRRYAPTKGPPPAMTQSQRQAAFRFAKCMRANGQPDFPDPTLTAPTGARLVLVLRGLVFAPGPGIDPKSPAFRQAATRCGVAPPGEK